MAIDVIIPGTTPWVLTNAALGPGETVETAVGLNGRYMAIAEMASRGYVVGAQIQQASADVQADKERLALLQDFQAGRFDGLDFGTIESSRANTELLQSLGVNTANTAYRQVATLDGPRVNGWNTSPFGSEQYPSFTQVQLTLFLPPIAYNGTSPIEGLIPVTVPITGRVEPVYAYPGGSLFYVVRSPTGQSYQMLLGAGPVTTSYLTSIPANQAAQVAADIDPTKLDAEIEKTIQISQGKQTYLQSLVTDYSTFYTTTGNMIQDYLKLLTSLVSRIG